MAGSQPDLVALANAYADAISAKKIAKVKFKRFAELEDKNVIFKEKNELAKVEYETARLKYMVLRQITEVWVQAAAEEHKVLQAVYETKSDDTGLLLSRVIQAQAKLKILKAISELQ